LEKKEYHVRDIIIKREKIVEIEFMDENESPIHNLRYVIHLPNGEKREGRSNEKGIARVKITGGDMLIEVPDSKAIIPIDIEVL